MHKLALIIVVIIMRETVEKYRTAASTLSMSLQILLLDPKRRKRYKNLASMLWSQNTDMYDLLFITDSSRTTLTASVDTLAFTHTYRHTEIKVGLL